MSLSLKVFGILIILILALVFLLAQNSLERNDTLRVGDNRLEIEVAISPADKARGLGGRESLPENQGMLFVYDMPGYYSFWMKDMNFAIDIIWLDANKKIIDITRDVRPESYPSSFSSQSPAQYILEVNSGWAERHGVEIADYVGFAL